ncbi:class E sortase [Streptomyces sp. DSM 44915]|uniref:Class E sortase n=1 Tax=Streptomyces chisholmiae TaxID=3075540 RepID=A0ABU2JQD7_9ACTN|nr:class E sortase [Streptomyces sp. DSM 44915]MDT0267127.1 class E sortase [Streptomyces sp. DSM 44915]
MTAARPPEGADWDPHQQPYAEDPYAGRGGAYPTPGTTGADPYQAAVDALADPLGDPLPGQRRPAEPGHPGHGDPPAGGYGSDGVAVGYGADELAAGGYPANGFPGAGGYPAADPAAGGPGADGYGYPNAQDGPGGPAERDPQTVGLRRPDDLRRPPRWAEPAAEAGAGPAGPETAAEPPVGGRAARRRAAQAAAQAGGPAAGASTTSTTSTTSATAAEAGGRAARRRAAKAGGRRGAAEAPADPATPDPAEPEAGGGRAARRKAAKAAAKAAKQTGTAISNVIGELFITTGVLLLLFVVYQLWWTNVEARAHANNQADELQERWDQSDEEAADAENRDPGVFSAGEGFALLYLPTLDVRVPVAESVDPSSVLDNGMVGHYSEEDRLPTAMPWDEEGNFGLAGHRNTHGEPFRYINRLEPGDPIVIETETTYYVYEMRSRLDSTQPSNTAVLDPVPEQGGFTEPGRYITLTTCTPEFTSTYRLIVWGELAEERPRAEGMPDALVN